MAIQHLTQSDFSTTIESSDIPVLVDFWAPWCGPCRMIAPILEQLETEMGDKVLFAKLNVDDEGAIAQELQVMSIPTMILFKNAEAVATQVGLLPKDRLAEWLNQYI